MQFSATREIGIDAAHRVTTHGSKCAHLHGHRYTVQATVVAEELGEGVETGMALDFGFLKQLMLEEIDAPADHGLILWDGDPWAETFKPRFPGLPVGPFGKVWMVPVVPTAENLAKLWFDALTARVAISSNGRAALSKVRVWETPNCFAEYPA